MSIEQLITEHLDIWTAADTEKKSGRGRGSANSGNVYGIKKLRELILELAVRGKLVPQDPHDEPASELLKRIQAEKAKLIAEGKIKKDKPLAPITEEQKPFELPVGWEWVFLPDVSEYKVGKTPSTKSSVYWTTSGDGFNWVSIADLNHDGSVLETAKKITDKAVSEVFRYEPAPVGTILMSFKLTLGKISTLEVPAFHNEAIISIYPDQSILKDYLFKVLPARAMAGNSKSAIKGNTLNSESIAALMIPLPPLPEQHRIVAKVDELMALCDQLENQHNNAAEAHEKLVAYLLGTLTQSQNAEDFNTNWQRIAKHFDILFTTETSIDELKQTLLQLAVMGKLVPQDPNDEPASELLKRIQAEKAKLLAEGKIKKSKPLAEITDDEKPFELPIGWEWARLDDFVLSIISGGTPSKNNSEFWNGDIPWASVKDLNVERFLDKTQDYITKEGLVAGSKLANKGDLIICTRMGLGKIAIASIDVAINQDLKALKITSQLDIDYFINFYSTLKIIGSGMTVAGIKQDELLGFYIPTPPLPEQHRIVAKVDELMAICDQLKTRINEANELQRKIADAVVGQAM